MIQKMLNKDEVFTEADKKKVKSLLILALGSSMNRV